MARRRCRPAAAPYRGAFTLVELLVVIGIITILIALLLPVLNSVRESARRVSCAGNLRQLAVAMLQYRQEMRDYPSISWVQPKAWDWIHWQDNRDLSESALCRYLGRATPELFRCPSDDLDAHHFPLQVEGRPQVYRYSYEMNLCLNITSGEVFGFNRRATYVRYAGDVIMMIEGDEATIMGGRWYPAAAPSALAPQSATTPWQDLLANRHDPKRFNHFPDGYPADPTRRPDADNRGNAAFADGHVSYITRRESWDRRRWDPWLESGRPAAGGIVN